MYRESGSRTPFEGWIILYDRVVLLAPGNKEDQIEQFVDMGVEVRALDYNPKFHQYKHYEVVDFIFDDVSLKADCLVHYNCEKTYYKINYTGDIILRGDDRHKNGDCNPITSCEQLIMQYELKEVYDTVIQDCGKHKQYIVWGKR